MRRTAVTVLAVTMAGAWGAMAPGVTAQSGLAISVLSSRPDMVSGGDALIEIKVPAVDGLTVTLNGQEVTRAFEANAARQSVVGLVEGLKVGANRIEARRGSRSARLDLTNYPITGPIVSGEHLKPFLCSTTQSGLGEPLDEDCSAPTKVEYFYRSSTPPPVTASGAAPAFGPSAFKRLENPTGPPPADLAKTTTSAGKTVPYIVRVESGTINRAIYRLAILDDPSKPASGTWTPGEGWNGRLMVTFGGGCGTNYNQGVNQAAGVLFDPALSRGFAHIISTQNVMQQHCNDNLSAEALMMLKEHFIERYGVPAWTLGFGGSGGAIQQLLIAQNFPGLLDGILPSLTFPDSVSVRPGVTDCRLLINYFTQDPATWTQAKQTAVEGHTPGTCRAWDRSFVDTIVATNVRGCGIPSEQVYDPVKNPKGARCTTWDTNVAIYGRDPSTGFARQSLDNVGVQYGLEAFTRGEISAAEFLDLNQKIGGFDRDGRPRPERSVADPEATRMEYATGHLDSGAGGLAATPILHFRSYNDGAGDIHDRFRDLSVRERLRKANGRFDNQVIWIYPGSVAGLGQRVTALAIDTMSQWLDALTKAPAAGSPADRIKRTKPAGAIDGCWDLEGTRIDEVATFDGAGRCNTLFPNHKNPRLVAGAPLADDVTTCTLKPVDAHDYQIALTADQMQTLKAIFPRGVCDYSKPGPQQAPLAGTYLRLPLPSRAQSTTTSKERQ
jgi:hypothetical protein